MSMFTLAISCLTTSNLPWFTVLTFQVPVQCCSAQLCLTPYYFFSHVTCKTTPPFLTGDVITDTCTHLWGLGHCCGRAPRHTKWQSFQLPCIPISRPCHAVFELQRPLRTSPCSRCGPRAVGVCLSHDTTQGAACSAVEVRTSRTLWWAGDTITA